MAIYRKLLLVIDLQNDFIEGKLAVPGANKVVDYLTNMLNEKVTEFDDILLTTDSHPSDHISFASSWSGDIKPFDNVKYEDIVDGKYYYKKPYVPKGLFKFFKNIHYYYFRDLRMPFTVWPDHCIEGTWGEKISEKFLQSVRRWRIVNNLEPKIFRKGIKPRVEMYSAFSPYTGVDSYLEKRMWNYMNSFTTICVAGLAKDFCVYYSLRDMIASGLQDKIVVLKDGIAAIDENNDVVNEFYNSFVIR